MAVLPGGIIRGVVQNNVGQPVSDVHVNVSVAEQQSRIFFENRLKRCLSKSRDFVQGHIA